MEVAASTPSSSRTDDVELRESTEPLPASASSTPGTPVGLREHNASHMGLIGPAGEVAVRSALIASGAPQPAAPGAGETKNLLGVTLPGALDRAGFIVPVVSGLPQTPVTTIAKSRTLAHVCIPQSCSRSCSSPWPMGRCGSDRRSPTPASRSPPIRLLPCSPCPADSSPGSTWIFVINLIIASGLTWVATAARGRKWLEGRCRRQGPTDGALVEDQRGGRQGGT